MGTFNTGGIAAELDKFDGLARGVNEACEMAVKAGGKALAKRLQEAAPERSGKLKKSIKAGTVDYNAADGFHCDVGPTGKNERGEPYAKIGNILEYGRSAQHRDPGRDVNAMSAKAWFNPAVAQAEGEVKQAMQKAFEEAQAHG